MEVLEGQSTINGVFLWRFQDCWDFIMGKSAINGEFSIAAMLDYQRVYLSEFSWEITPSYEILF